MSLPSGPRIPPARGGEAGLIGRAILAVLARGTGRRSAPNVFATLAHHPRLFRSWLLFAGSLMPGGRLPRADTELVILRVAHNAGSEYEWRHHVRIGRRAGLSAEEIERVREGPEAVGWNERQRLALGAADELRAERRIGDGLWTELAAEFSQVELIELVMLIGHYEMLAGALASFGVELDLPPQGQGGASGGGPGLERPPSDRADSPLAGRRILITGAARGIGAATARLFHRRGARVALLGIEPEELRRVAADCGGAPAIECDVRDRAAVERAVEEAVSALGGLDVVIANAGVAAQLPLLGGDPDVFDRTLDVNLRGTYYTLRAAAPHIAHPGGYALAISSLAAAVHAPLIGAYSASKAGVEALANTLRIELKPSGARVGVAYFAELDTDMTRRGFVTEAAQSLPSASLMRVAPLATGLRAIERGVIRRSRRVVAPAWVGPVLPIRMVAQRVVDLAAQRGLERTLEIARREHAPLTTPLPERDLRRPPPERDLRRPLPERDLRRPLPEHD